MEDADDLVDRRVVDVLLVAVVQPVELGRDDPQRERQHHHRDLHQGSEPLPPETISFARRYARIRPATSAARSAR